MESHMIFSDMFGVFSHTFAESADHFWLKWSQKSPSKEVVASDNHRLPATSICWETLRRSADRGMKFRSAAYNSLQPIACRHTTELVAKWHVLRPCIDIHAGQVREKAPLLKKRKCRTHARILMEFLCAQQSFSSSDPPVKLIQSPIYNMLSRNQSTCLQGSSSPLAFRRWNKLLVEPWKKIQIHWLQILKQPSADLRCTRCELKRLSFWFMVSNMSIKAWLTKAIKLLFWALSERRSRRDFSRQGQLSHERHCFEGGGHAIMLGANAENRATVGNMPWCHVAKISKLCEIICCFV